VARHETHESHETRHETPAPRNEIRDEISRIVVLRACLEGAAQGHFDPDADIEPIRALLDQGCDLEADILPTVAREVPELPRPLRNWGAQWTEAINSSVVPAACSAFLIHRPWPRAGIA
jgi:hypothetical protein